MPLGSSKIRLRRNELGLSQLDLARRADISVRTVQFAEAGKKMTRATLEAIANALNYDCEELVDVRTDAAHDRDAFLQSPWSLFKFVQKKLCPSELAFCREYEDAQASIAQMRNSWRTHLERSSSHNDDNIFGVADRIMDQRYDAYEQRYLSIWKRNPNTLLFSAANDVRTGISVILPVSDEAYERLRTGKISFMEITADDICERSQNLIVDSAHEFPNNSNLAWHQITESLSFAVFSQMSMLAKNPAAENFRMISFGASPINIKRLESSGFVKRPDVKMPHFEFPLFEFVGNSNDLLEDCYEKTSTVSHVLHLLGRNSLVNTKIKATRNVITRVLRGLQLLGKSHFVSGKSSDQKAA